MKKRPLNPNVGAWVGIGAGIGAALYAATQEPVWIAVGVALGAALGISKTEKTKKTRCKEIYLPSKTLSTSTANPSFQPTSSPMTGLGERRSSFPSISFYVCRTDISRESAISQPELALILTSTSKGSCFRPLCSAFSIFSAISAGSRSESSRRSSIRTSLEFPEDSRSS